jgi:crotonobetainyl-CoA:carnitine CoA-transferase CaiB-like acyl-CoA transferase
MFGAIGALAALFERNHSGVGKEVQSALFENCVLLSAQHMQQFAVTGVAAAPMPERISAWAVYDVFTLAGGEQMFVAATGDGQWRALCKILERADLLADPRLATNNDRVLVRPWLLQTLGETLARFHVADLVEQFERDHIPFASITKPEDLFDDKHLIESGGLVSLTLEDGTETQMPLLPIAMDGARLQPRRAIPKIGEHTAEVLESLGYGRADIEKIMGSEPAKAA